MLRIIKGLVLVMLSATVLIACKKSGTEPTPPPVPDTQKDIAAIDGKLQAFMTTYNIPGASLAVSKNGKLVYLKAYGVADKTTNEKLTTAHRFRLASVSKSYTGIAILKLVQEGKITLDGKVFGAGSILGTDYGTAPYNANLTSITVRQLLQHVTGAWGASTGGDVIDANPAYTNKQLLDWIINTRTMPKAPGTFYDYSNVNYFILGRIIEKISGKSYINYIKEDLGAGVGANSLDIAGKTLADKKSNEVSYAGQGTDAPFTYTIAFPRRDADGGLISTAADLLKIVTAVDGFATRPDILNASTITQLTTPSAAYSGYACGIGIWSAESVWFNYGSLPGTRTGFMRHDNGMCAAILLNSRVDPTTGENPFVYGLQDVLLDIVKNSGYSWQAIDQF